MNNEMVYPGSPLAAEEEFAAGTNAFESDGNVVSDSVGLKVLDQSKYEAGVTKSTKVVKILERGTIVTCVVSLVKLHAVLVEIREGEMNGQKRAVHDRNGSINVRNISNTYVKSTDDCYRAGDVLKARVLDVTTYGVELETKSPEFGVVKAYGIRSRKPLHLIDGKLRDPATGDTEERKVSSEYLLR